MVAETVARKVSSATSGAGSLVNNALVNTGIRQTPAAIAAHQTAVAAANAAGLPPPPAPRGAIVRGGAAAASGLGRVAVGAVSTAHVVAGAAGPIASTIVSGLGTALSTKAGKGALLAAIIGGGLFMSGDASASEVPDAETQKTTEHPPGTCSHWRRRTKPAGPWSWCRC